MSGHSWWRWLRYLNPLTPLLDFWERQALRVERREELARLDRQEERELQRQSLLTLGAMIEKAFDANRSQNDALRTFLDSFRVTDQPVLREWDDAEAETRYANRMREAYAEGSGLPAELAGLDRIGQFEALLDISERP